MRSRVPRTTKPGASAGGWLTDQVLDLIDELTAANADAVDRSASALLETVRSGGLIHVAASGHGLILVMEAFYRAGGLACVNPIWDLDLLPIRGARRSTVAERTIDLGTRLIDEAAVSGRDVVVVASQSGVNPVPVDIASRARERGAVVIAITSLPFTTIVASRDRIGRRVADIADIVIDTRVPVGDAVYPIGPGLPRVAPLSTIATVHAWNLVLVRLGELSRVAGTELPVWLSSNVPGGDARLAELIAEFGHRIPALR